MQASWVQARHEGTISGVHPHDMYRPIVEMDTTAPKAVVEFSMGRPRMKASVT